MILVEMSTKYYIIKFDLNKINKNTVYFKNNVNVCNIHSPKQNNCASLTRYLRRQIWLDKWH